MLSIKESHIKPSGYTIDKDLYLLDNFPYIELCLVVISIMFTLFVWVRLWFLFFYPFFILHVFCAGFFPSLFFHKSFI